MVRGSARRTAGSTLLKVTLVAPANRHEQTRALVPLARGQIQHIGRGDGRRRDDRASSRDPQRSVSQSADVAAAAEAVGGSAADAAAPVDGATRSTILSHPKKWKLKLMRPPRPHLLLLYILFRCHTHRDLRLIPTYSTFVGELNAINSKKLTKPLVHNYIQCNELATSVTRF